MKKAFQGKTSQSDTFGMKTIPSHANICPSEKKIISAIILRAIDDLSDMGKNGQDAFLYFISETFLVHCDFLDLDGEEIINSRFIYTPSFIRHLFMHQRNIVSSGSKTFDLPANLFSKDLQALNKVIFNKNRRREISLVEVTNSLKNVAKTINFE